jgi:hypothetical protein
MPMHAVSIGHMPPRCVLTFHAAPIRTLERQHLCGPYLPLVALPLPRGLTHLCLYEINTADMVALRRLKRLPPGLVMLRIEVSLDASYAAGAAAGGGGTAAQHVFPQWQLPPVLTWPLATGAWRESCGCRRARTPCACPSAGGTRTSGWFKATAAANNMDTK